MLGQTMASGLLLFGNIHLGESRTQPALLKSVSTAPEYPTVFSLEFGFIGTPLESNIPSIIRFGLYLS